MEKTEIVEKLAANVRSLMNAKSLSSAQVAKRCGISTGTISKIINGNMSITIAMLAALCKGLDVPTEDILNGIIEKREKNREIVKTNKTGDIFAGILSINHKRVSCIKDTHGHIMGTSELDGDLDLAETIPSLLARITESIDIALVSYKNRHKNYLKSVNLTVVVQSYEFEDTRRKFTNYLKRYFKTVNVLSDWQITYLASFRKSEGISLVVDKGVSLTFKQNKKLKKLGGWKFPVYDLGGENWLGVMAIRHTIEAYEGYIPMSVLAHAILGKFNNKIEKITETCFKAAKWKHGPTIDPDVYCGFANILLRNYFLGDEASKNILQQGFNFIYRAVEKVDALLKKKHKIVLNGSLQDIYIKFFTEDRLIPSPSDEKKAKLLAGLIKNSLLDI